LYRNPSSLFFSFHSPPPQHLPKREAEIPILKLPADFKPVLVPYASLKSVIGRILDRILGYILSMLDPARRWVSGDRSGELRPWDERADFLEEKCRALRLMFKIRGLAPHPMYCLCIFALCIDLGGKIPLRFLSSDRHAFLCFN
jgi:hypothetical protein